MCMLLCFRSINTNKNNTLGIIRFVKWYSTICFDNKFGIHSEPPNMLTLTKLSIILKQRNQYKGEIAD